MFDSRDNLGLLLGFIGVAVFAGTLPATRMGVASFAVRQAERQLDEALADVLPSESMAGQDA